MRTYIKPIKHLPYSFSFRTLFQSYYSIIPQFNYTYYAQRGHSVWTMYNLAPISFFNALNAFRFLPSSCILYGLFLSWLPQHIQHATYHVGLYLLVSSRYLQNVSNQVGLVYFCIYYFFLPPWLMICLHYP